MIQKSKNEVFGYFLEFGLLDRLDIAYCRFVGGDGNGNGCYCIVMSRIDLDSQNSKRNSHC